MTQTNNGNSRVTALKFIDLFAGAGGLAEGFSSVGFKPIAHVEMNADACQTLRTRECYHYLKHYGNINHYYNYLKGNITRKQLYSLVPKNIINSVICESMSNNTMSSIYKNINNSMKRAKVSHIDLVIGGPPCQAYSQVGRSRKCMDNDPRNELYKHYIQILKKYNPTLFVFENVPGLITAGGGSYLSDILAKFRSLGYSLDYKIVDASDFGVLQKRKRIILIGWQSNTNHHYPEFVKKSGIFTVADILNDLPKIHPGESADKYNEKNISTYLIETDIRIKQDVLTWHIARSHIDRDREIYRHAIKAWNDGQKRLKYSDLPLELTTHKNKSGFLDRFKVVAADLATCHTMMAHISKDGHYYIHPDIEQVRSITVREAARIQSFPDNFFFEGSRTSAFMQIGNAVPPLMAKAIAAALYEQYIKEKDNG